MQPDIDRLFEALGDPGFLALVLESLLFWGPFLGALLYVFAWITGEGKSRKFALLLILVASLCSIAHRELAASAAEGFALVPPDEGTAAALAAHLAAGASWQWAYYVLAGLATLALFAGHNGKTGIWLTILTLLGSLAITVLSLALFLEGAGDLPVELPPGESLLLGPAEGGA